MSKVFVCGECGAFMGLGGPDTSRCRWCSEVGKARPLRREGVLGLIGCCATGKTVYLATLHDQLMHSAPEWRVEVSDWAFRYLTRDYQRMLSGSRPAKTVACAPPFLMRVFRQRRELDLLMWDAAGEEYTGLAPDSKQRSKKSYRTMPLLLLLECKVIMVTIGSFWCEHGKGPMARALAEQHAHADQDLGALFRTILRKRPLLRHVIVLLVGVDVHADNPRDADPLALHEFESRYRVFPGVLKNAGIRVDIVPLSNFGFENVFEDCPIGPPRPYNVLEPLRLAFPTYLPRWRRLFVRGRRREQGTSPPSGVSSAESRSSSRGSAPNLQTAFISYRREADAETARLIRSELRARGWQAFLDVEDLGASRFDDRILLEIQNATCFIVILSPGSLDRCAQKKDWVRREVAHAISRRRHIVPLVKEGFSFPPEEALPEPIRALPNYNCVKYSHEYFRATMDKLVSFLSERAG